MVNTCVLRKYYFIFLIILLLTGCNFNPLGGKNSHVDNENAPFLSTPNSFTITDTLATSGQISLIWGAADKADFYTVMYGTSSRNYSNSLSNCTALTVCVIPNLNNGTRYYIKVMAENLYGTVNSLNEVAATPGAFNSLVALAGNKEIYLSWTGVDVVNSYTISYGVYPGPYTNTITGVTNNYAVIPNLVNGTTYQFLITATNSIGTVISNQALGTPTTPPNAPTGVIATAFSSSQINLSWNAAVGVGTITYQVNRSLVSGGPYGVIDSGLSSLTYSDTTALSGTKYYYVVVASNNAGISPNSSEVSATTPPSPPMGLTASNLTISSVNFNWLQNAGNSTITYTLKRGSVSGGPYSNVTGCSLVGVLNCTDTTVAAATQYYYVLVANNSTASSGISSELSVITPPAKPTALAFSSVTSSSLNLTWTGSSGTAGLITYEVSRTTLSGGNYSLVAGCTGLTTNTCSDSSLTAATQYYYIVTATTSGGTSPKSSEGMVTTLATPPASLTATATASNFVTLNWQASSANVAVTYVVKRSITSGTGYALISSGTCSSSVSGTSCTDTSTTAGIQYYYVVTATAGGVTSGNSNEAGVVTPVGSPSGLTATAASSSSINLSWTASTGTASLITYNVLRSNTPGSDYASFSGVCSNLTGVTSCVDSTVSPGTKYYYVVTATAGGTTTANSNEANATTYTTAPTNLVASTASLSTSTINLSWNASPGNVSITYTVTRSITSGSGYVAITSGTCSAVVTSSLTTCTDTSASPGVTYYYVVKATTSGGVSSPSLEANATTYTTAPTGLSTSLATTSSLTLSWTASPGTAPITYIVTRSNTSGSGYTAITNGSCSIPITSPTFTCTDTSALPGTNYYYVVTASTAGGMSSISTQAIGTTKTNPPESVSATALSSTSISITWSASPGNASFTYNVMRSSTMGSNYAPISTGTCSSPISSLTVTCTDTSASPASTYYYIVNATTAGGISTNSTEVSATTFAVPPTGLTASSTDTATINLTWVASSGSANITYTVMRSVTSGSGYNAISSGTCSLGIVSPTATCTDTSGSPGTKYYYIVKASTSSGGNSAPSNEANATTFTTAPNPLSAIASSSTQITLTWALSPGTAVITYQVLRSTTSGSGYVGISSGTCSSVMTSPTATCTDTSAAAGTPYYYVITATTLGGGTSSFSTEIAASTFAGAPSGLAATSVGGGKVSLTWNASSGTAGITYILNRSQTSGGPYSVIESNLTTTSYTDTSVSNGVIYYYVIQSVTSAGNSGNSSEISVTPINSFSVLTNSASPTQISLTWSAATGATNYTVKQSTTLGGSSNGTSVASCTSIATTSCTITSLTNNTTYYYTVFANNTGVSSTASNSTSEIANTPFASPFTNILAGTSQVNLNWTAVTNATNYTIYVSSTSGNAVAGNTIATGCNSVTGLTCTATGLTNGTKYYFALVANLSSGGTFTSGEVFATPIGIFDISSLTALSSSSAQVSWSTALGATQYNVKYGISSNSYTFTNGPFSSSPATISGLSAGTTYYVRMTAENGQGSVTSNSEYSVTTKTSPPTNLSASAASSSLVDITWNASPGNALITYNVSRSVVSGSDYLPINTGTCSSAISSPTFTCNDTSVLPGVKYYYVVTAAIAGMTTLNSIEANVVTPTTSPTNLSAGSSGATTASLSWAASPGSEPITYTVGRSSVTGGPYTNVVGCINISALSCTDTNVSSGNVYYYVVTAKNSAGSTLPSTEASLTGQAAAPTNLTAVASNSTTINISWTGSSGTASISYIVTRSTMSGSGYVPISSGTCSSGVSSPATSCTDTSANPGTTYYYIVKASTNGGISGASNEASATTYSTIPTGVTATAQSPTNVTITWSASSGQASITYTVTRSTTNGSGYVAILAGTCSSSVSALTCSDDSAAPGMTYYYVVKATVSGLSTLNSSQATATTFTTPPTNLVATAANTSTINLSWTISPGTASITYVITRSLTSGSGYGTISSGTCSTAVVSPTATCSDTSGTPGVKYYYIVTAVTAAGSLGTSNEAFATTYTSAPTNLVATAQSSTTINLTWTASPGDPSGVTYTVKRSLTLGTGYNVISSGTCSSSISSTSCSDQTASPGTTYYYVVSANTAGGSSAPSTAANATTFTTIPTGLAASVTSATVTLTWTASPGASVTYTVLRSSNSGTGYIPITAGTCSSAVSATTCTDTSVISGNIYYYVVNAQSAGVSTGSSAEVNASVIPSAPTGLTASAINNSTINLSWTQSTGNSNISYVVTRSTTIGSGYLPIASGSCSGTLTSSTSSCSDMTASSGVTYYYILKASNAGGTSGSSNEASATTFTTAPTGLTATAATTTSINLSWTAPIGAVTYTVQRSVTTGTGYAALTTGGCGGLVSGSSCSDSTANPGTQYFYVVIANNTAGPSGSSSEANASTKTAAPTGLTVNVVGTTSLVLAWSASPGSLSNTYTLMRSSVSGGPYSNVTSCVTISALTCTDSNVTAGTAYYYVVSAANSAGASTNSSELSAVTLSTVPSGFSATANGSTVNLNWTATSGTSSLITYTLNRSTVSGSSYSTISSGISTTAYSDSSVTAGTPYYYTVLSKTSGGNSLPSSEISVTPIASFSITSISSSANQLIVNWGTATGAANYTVKQSTSSGGSGTGSNVTGCIAIATTTCTVTGLVNGTTYYFTVFANNTGINSTATANTAESSGTPFSSSLNVTGIASAQVSFSWSSITNTTNYNIKYSTVSGSAASGTAATGCSSLSSGILTCTATGLTNGTLYYFALIANLSTGGTVQSSEVSATPIGTFDITTATAASTTSANISWGASSGASSYTIQYGLASNTYTGSQGSITTTSAVLTGLSPGNLYYIRVKAVNASGNISSNSEKQVTLPTTAPTGLTLSSVSTSAANLTWTASPGNSGITYVVSRSTTQGSNYVALTTGGCSGNLVATSCSDTSVSSGNTYYYVVTASNSTTPTGNSNELAVTTYPSAPTNLTGVSNSATQNQLSWSAITGNALGTTYSLKSSLTLGGPYDPVTGCTAITSLTCADNNVTAGTTYYYIIIANNSTGSSVKSTEFALTTFTTPPTSPLASVVSNSQINVSWTSSPGTATITYTVLRSITQGTGYSVITSGGCSGTITSPTSTCQDTNVTAGIKYYYVIQVSPAAASLNQSTETSATTKTTTPTNLAATASSSTEVVISWTKSPGTAAITYTVKRANAIAGPFSAIATGSCNAAVVSPIITCTDESVTAGNTYYYVITATVGGNTTPPSTAVSTTTPTAAPTNLVATATTTSQMNLSWTASPGSSTMTYVVSRSLVTKGPYSPITSGTCASLVTSTTTCTDTSVAAGTTYYYVVTAQAASSTTSANSTEANGTTTTTAPTTVTATANSTSAVTVSWTASPGSATVTYNVLRSTTSGTNYVAIATGVCSSPITSTLSCEDTNISPGVIYYYVVTAQTGTVASGNSTQASVIVPTIAPSGLVATATSSTNVNLSWTASPGNSSITYNVLRSSNSNGTYSAISSGTCNTSVSTTTCTDTSVTAGNLYYYIVQASNGAAILSPTANSNIANTTTQTTAPTGLVATISGASSVTLTWNASPGNAPITYTAQRSTTTGSNYGNITQGTCSTGISSTVTCSDLSPSVGSTYYYVVTAKNAYPVATGNSNEASLFFSAPIKSSSDQVTFTNGTSSGIIANSGTVLTGSHGTWSDTSNCVNKWYANNLLTNVTTSAYTTQSSDACRVISYCVTCTNPVGSNTACNNGVSSSTNGIVTANILSAYATRVSSVAGNSLTTAGQNQIKSFLDNLITNNQSFPDIFYAIQNSQNAGYGSSNNTTIYDLYCNAHNASITNSAYTWDKNGVLGNSALATAPNYGIAISNNSIFFNNQPSTMVAYAQTPSSSTSYNGIIGYSSNTSSRSFHGIGYNIGSNTTIFDDIGLTTISNSNTGYNFVGRSLSGSNITYDINGNIGTPTANTTAFGSGNFILGNYPQNSTQTNKTLNGYLPFAAAWTSQALTFAQLETIRTAYTSNFPTPVPLAFTASVTGTIYTCTLNSNNSFPSAGSCTQSSGFGSGVSITSSSTYLYAVNSSGTVYSCPITNNKIPTTSAGCNSIGGFGDSYPTIFTANNYVYVVLYSNNKIYSCPLSNGVVPGPGGCSLATGFSGPYAGFVSNGYIYFDGYAASGSVYSCPLTGGTIVPNAGSCPKSFTFTNAWGLAYNRGFAYVGDYNNGYVFACSLSSSTFPNSTSCSKTTGFGTIWAITSNPNNNNVYIINSSGTVYTCAIASNGTIPNASGCLSASGFGSGYGISIY
ncbi:beta strand repeat-containing protein [Silvanigrella aquatica]|uniref:Fibronectin type-III domain-containing protein n=1 Tax=Silvanigrella aquatica TaxID=1915309 RepID=A0A1L4D0N4_9BACT|nr:fibronectin type III domain-containing protein [Silvanigrella aquatica]APJ03782.1 hypothetical protein AXG55_07630 [Silvanigrella aquatica]